MFNKKYLTKNDNYKKAVFLQNLKVKFPKCIMPNYNLIDQLIFCLKNILLNLTQMYSSTFFISRQETQEQVQLYAELQDTRKLIRKVFNDSNYSNRTKKYLLESLKQSLKQKLQSEEQNKLLKSSIMRLVLKQQKLKKQMSLIVLDSKQIKFIQSQQQKVQLRLDKLNEQFRVNQKDLNRRQKRKSCKVQLFQNMTTSNAQITPFIISNTKMTSSIMIYPASKEQNFIHQTNYTKNSFIQNPRMSKQKYYESTEYKKNCFQMMKPILKTAKIIVEQNKALGLTLKNALQQQTIVNMWVKQVKIHNLQIKIQQITQKLGISEEQQKLPQNKDEDMTLFIKNDQNIQLQTFKIKLILDENDLNDLSSNDRIHIKSSPLKDQLGDNAVQMLSENKLQVVENTTNIQNLAVQKSHIIQNTSNSSKNICQENLQINQPKNQSIKFDNFSVINLKKSVILRNSNQYINQSEKSKQKYVSKAFSNKKSQKSIILKSKAINNSNTFSNKTNTFSNEIKTKLFDQCDVSQDFENLGENFNNLLNYSAKQEREQFIVENVNRSLKFDNFQPFQHLDDNSAKQNSTFLSNILIPRISNHYLNETQIISQDVEYEDTHDSDEQIPVSQDCQDYQHELEVQEQDSSNRQGNSKTNIEYKYVQIQQYHQTVNQIHNQFEKKQYSQFLRNQQNFTYQQSFIKSQEKLEIHQNQIEKSNSNTVLNVLNESSKRQINNQLMNNKKENKCIFKNSQEKYLKSVNNLLKNQNKQNISGNSRNNRFSESNQYNQQSQIQISHPFLGTFKSTENIFASKSKPNDIFSNFIDSTNSVKSCTFSQLNMFSNSGNKKISGQLIPTNLSKPFSMNQSAQKQNKYQQFSSQEKPFQKSNDMPKPFQTTPIEKSQLNHQENIYGSFQNSQNQFSNYFLQSQKIPEKQKKFKMNMFS